MTEGARGRKLLTTVAYVLGSVLMFIGIAMLLSAGVALMHSEGDVALGIAASAAITGGVGFFTRRLVKKPKDITLQQGFATVGLAWFVFSLFGALPYLLSGAVSGFTDAVFETTSGFTTTGASVLLPSSLPKGILFWRSLTQWLGGMGVIVLGVAVLPLLGTGGMQLARAESPGPEPDRLTPRFRETAKRLWLVYLLLTTVQVVFLAFGDMDLFQSILHSLSTVSTGGFSTEVASVAGFTAYTQWVIVVFMFLGGISFALHFRAWSKPIEYFRNSEFRLYVWIVIVASLLVFGGLAVDHATGDAIRDATFTTISLITTTGFASTDFGLWRPALGILVLGMMFVGGMAGSTAGGIKVFRIGVLAKAAYNDLRRLVYPRAVFAPRFGKTRLTNELTESVQSFFLFYMVLFLVSTFLLALIDANLTESLDLTTTTSAVAASLGNIGPGLGGVGPAYDYSTLPDLAKWLLSSLMIVGRLEIFPVLVLFTKDLWKR